MTDLESIRKRDARMILDEAPRIQLAYVEARGDRRVLLAEVDRLTSALESIRAALGDGADENLWPSGLTVAEAVERLAGAFPSPL